MGFVWSGPVNAQLPAFRTFPSSLPQPVSWLNAQPASSALTRGFLTREGLLHELALIKLRSRGFSLAEDMPID